MKGAYVEGLLSPPIIAKRNDQLVNKYNFDLDSIIEIKGTLGFVPRGGFIEGK